LQEHISTAFSNITSFDLILAGITSTENLGKYLFLNILKGSEEIIEIHKRLYTGILEKYFPEWLKCNNFLPHITIGNFDNEEEFLIAINDTRNISDSFITTVNEISVEIIDENEDSFIEFNVPLI
jgi:2'-5' RNA ligase